jgi:branched-subunit amino acid transport protein
MSTLAAIVAVGVGTLASRAVFIVGLANRAIPGAVLRALEYVGPATLSALIVTLMVSDGQVRAGLPEVAGLGAAALAGLKTTNLTTLLTVGMVTYWLMRAVV